MSTVGLLAEVPLEPSREQARSWAREELARREYSAAEPGPLERAIAWVLERLEALSLPGNPSEAVAWTVLALLVAVVIVLVLRRTGLPGRPPRGRRGARELFETAATTAAQHRAAADAAAAAGDLRTAVLERFRALVRDLEERAVLVEQPGRTADEAARAAAAALPALAEPLARAARLFDDVRYGDLPATPDADRSLRQVDDAVRRERPARAGATTVAAGASAGAAR